MTSAKIIVCSLDAMEWIVANSAAHHLISLINDHKMPQTPSYPDQIHHLKLPMNDIVSPVSGSVTPSNQHVEKLIEFVRDWDQLSPLVIHCWAGISRSTAAAFITLCALNPQTNELQLARSMREKSPIATPNRLLISCADQVLRRSGKMINAVESIGRGDMASSREPFSMSAVMKKSDDGAHDT